MFMQVTLFRNVVGENSTSMERYADALEGGLGRFANVRARSFSIKQTRFLRPLRIVLRFLPWFRHYTNDVFLSRYVLYPLLARGHQGEINHITDQLDSHLLRVLDPSRTVLTCHDLIPLDYEKDPIALKVFKWNIKFLRRAVRILADSEATKIDLVNRLGVSEDKIKVVYLGVSSDFIPVKDRDSVRLFREKLQLPSGRYVLHVGNSLEYKNRIGLLQAFEILCQQCDDVYLVILGSPSPTTESLSSGRVIYLSGLSDADLVLLYNLADVYVQPSYKEGFGWPPLEALACGTPVVSSNTSSLPEICGESVTYFSPFQHEEMAQKIQEVLSWSDDQRAKMVIKGIEQAAKFTWERCCEQIVEVYEEVARLNSQSPPSDIR